MNIYFIPLFYSLKNVYHHIIVVLGVHCNIYQSSYNIIIVEFTLSIILLYPLSPISGIVSTDPISPFLYMNTQYFHTVHLPTPFPYIFLRSTGTNPLLQTGPVLPFCSHF
jgi:hypothetical protein